MIRSILVAVAAAAGVYAHDTGAHLNKPPLTNGLGYLEHDLESFLPQTPYSYSQWNNGYIPQQCKDIVTGRVYSSVHYNPEDMDIYEVKYNDCGDPWIFCHHRASNGTIDTMARQFGKMPIQMRQWIRHVVDVPSDGGWAFEWNGDITFVRPVEDMLTAMIHEIGHSLDLNGAYGMPSLSDSDDWWNNYEQDPNVPDPYSQSTMMENVAQNTVIAVYNENVPQKYGGIEPNWHNLFHQFATVITHARNAGDGGRSLIQPGENMQCTHRLPNSNPVPKSQSAKRSALGAVPDVRFKSAVKHIDISHRKHSASNCNMQW